MKRALRYPSRWAGRWRTLIITAALTGLGACSSLDNVLYGGREGTMEYPGSGAGPNAVPTYVVKNKDTVDGIAQRYGVSVQSIVDRNRMQPPYPLRAGRTIEVPGAKYIGPTDTDVATQPAGPPGGPVKKEALAPPGQQAAAEPPPQRQQPAAGEPTPLSPAATPPPLGPTPRFRWPLNGKIITPYGTSAGQKSNSIDTAPNNPAPVQDATAGQA